MTRTMLILSGDCADPTAWPGLPHADVERIRHTFCADLCDLAGRIPASRVQIVSDPLPPAALSAALVAGPLLILSGDTPHLPLWRLHDAFTRLADGADLVAGPTDDGSWYLIGLRVATPELRAALPQPGAPLAPLIAAAHLQQQHLVLLPQWYRIADLTALEQLGADLRTMPDGTAHHTRMLLQPTQARAIGA
jgi:hypothetical protein